MRRAVEVLVALIAPPACVACRTPTGAGERLCARCTRALPWLRRTCPRCALPSHRGRACPAGAAAFRRAWAPLAYEGVARDLVTALKFRAALPVADLMAAHMAANLPPDLRRALTAAAADRSRPVADAAPWEAEAAVAAAPAASAAIVSARSGTPAAVAAAPAAPATIVPAGSGTRGAEVAAPASADAIVPVPTVAVSASAAVIVPVPTVAARRRRRGFDPAGVLAGALARRLDCSLVACLERRDRAGRQVGASRRVRRASGRLAFVARAPPPLVVLVDDVYTTGATLDAAARTLAGAGTTVLAALAYARTL